MQRALAAMLQGDIIDTQKKQARTHPAQCGDGFIKQTFCELHRRVI